VKSHTLNHCSITSATGVALQSRFFQLGIPEIMI
jgi:hypothetical protein